MINFTTTIFAVNRCDQTKDEFFEALIPNCKVEDDCVCIINGDEYDIERQEVKGIDVQRDIEFYRLVKY